MSKIWNKISWLNVAIVVALIFATSIILVKTFDLKIEQNGDNIYYFALGQSLSQNNGYVHNVVFETHVETHFPPGYPLLISLLMRTGLDSVRDVKIMNGVFLALSVLVCFFIFLHLTKRRWLSFFVSLLVAVNASLLYWASIMMSEIPYLFWTSLSILLFLKAFDFETISTIKMRHYILFVAAVFGMVFAYFVKSIGMALFLAMCVTLGIEAVRILALWWKKGREEGGWAKSNFGKHAIVIGGFVMFAFLGFYVPSHLWNQRAKHAGVEGNAYVSTFFQKSDGTKMETFADWEERFTKQTQAAVRQWIPYSIFQNKTDNPNLNPISWFLGILLLGVLFWGAYKANSWLLFLYVGCSIGVQLFYNETYAGMRYMIAVVPFLIFYFVYGIYTLVDQIIVFINKKFKPNIILDLVVIAVLAMMIAPTYAESLERREKSVKFQTWNIYNTAPSFVEFQEMAKWISQNISRDEKISNRKPEIFYMYSNYFRSTGMPGMNTPIDDVLTFLDTEKVNYIVLDRWFGRAYNVFYPVIQKHPEKFKLVHSIKVEAASTVPTLLFEYLPNS